MTSLCQRYLQTKNIDLQMDQCQVTLKENSYNQKKYFASFASCPIKVFDGDIYPLLSIEHFQSSNIENQPMTYIYLPNWFIDIYQILGGKQDPFKCCDEWLPPTITIFRFTIVTSVMFWGCLLCKCYKTYFMNKIKTESFL